MLLNNFTQGLNTKVTPHLIGLQESVICNNVNIDGVSLAPLKSDHPIGINIASDGSFVYFKGQWISGNLSTSFVEFNDSMYYSDSVGPLMKNNGVEDFEVGIEASDVKPTSASGEVGVTFTSSIASGDLIPNTYNYVFVYYTSLGEYAKKIVPYTYTGTASIQVNITLPTIVTSALVYRVFEGTSRFLGELTPTNLSLTDSVLNIGLKNSLDYLDSSNPVDVRQYCFTYYRISDGTESAPSLISDELLVLGDVTVNNIQPAFDSSVSHIRLYRIGGDLIQFNLVAELLPTATSYVDSLTDVEIADKGVLETIGSVKTNGLKHLTEYASSLFAAKGNELWFSDVGVVDRWFSTNYIVFPEEITGLGATQNGLLIFSRNRTHILIGTSSSNYSKFLLSDSQGCLQHKSIQYSSNTLFWLSLDGICASSGGDVVVISEPKLGKLNLEPISSEFYDGKYYLFHDAGTLIADTRQGLTFRTLSLIVNGCWYGHEFDKLYYADNEGWIYEYGTGLDDVEYQYKTGWLVPAALSEVKLYKSIYTYSSGVVSLTLYMDGVLIKEFTLGEGFSELKLPSPTIRGYYSELSLVGTGTVREIEFKTEGRQNGK